MFCYNYMGQAVAIIKMNQTFCWVLCLAIKKIVTSFIQALALVYELLAWPVLRIPWHYHQILFILFLLSLTFFFLFAIFDIICHQWPFFKKHFVDVYQSYSFHFVAILSWLKSHNSTLPASDKSAIYSLL